MSWEQIVENIKIFWSQPVPVIGFTVGTVVIALLFLIGKTSFGKKALKKANDKVESLRADYSQFKSQAEELNENLKKYYEEKLALMNEAKEREQELIIAIGEKIHNVEINELVNGYKEQIHAKEIVISDAVESKVNETKEQYNKQLEEYKAQLEYLINEYKYQVELAKQQAESQVANLDQYRDDIVDDAKNITEIIHEDLLDIEAIGRE